MRLWRGNQQASPWETTRSILSFGRRLFILLAIAALVLPALTSFYPPSAWEGDQATYAIRYGLFGFFILAALAASRQSLAALGLQLAIWFGVLILLVGAYGYRNELTAFYDRILGQILPSHAATIDAGTVRFTRANDGHFHIDAVVNGKPVRFLLDTGASAVVLTRADAARLGFDAAQLKFSQIFETANGRTRGAPVALQSLRIGPLAFDHVAASVNEGEMRQSLLGMRLLEKFSSIEIRNDTLTIRR